MYKIFKTMSRSLSSITRTDSSYYRSNHDHQAVDCFVGYEHWNAPVLDRIQAKDVARRLRKEEDVHSTEDVATFRHSELVLGSLLGKGSFSGVYEIQAFKLLKSGDDDARVTLQRRCRDDPSSYVVKILRPELLDSPKTLASCAADLAKEGSMLASLSHDHILSVRAWADCGLRGYATGRHDAFFLVLDRLHDTLADRLRKWRLAASTKKWIMSPQRRKRAQDQKKVMLESRLTALIQLADAIQYLHANRIVHRDLKPDNIGYNYGSGVKVFDFDLAKRLPDTGKPGDVFKLTKKVGSPRYMSPECARGERYNESADTYAFGLLTHQLLSLAKPFGTIPTEEHETRVVYQKARPVIPSSWLGTLSNLIRTCWSDDLSERPSMQEVHSTLLQNQSRLLDERPKDGYILQRFLSGRKSTSEQSASSSRRSWSIKSWRRGKQSVSSKRPVKLKAPQPVDDGTQHESSDTIPLSDDDPFLAGSDSDEGDAASSAGSVESTHSVDRRTVMNRRSFMPTLGTIKSARMMQSSRSVTALLDME